MDTNEVLDACEKGASLSRPSEQTETEVLERSSTDPVLSHRENNHEDEIRRTNSDPGGQRSDFRQAWWWRSENDREQRPFTQALAVTLGSVPIRLPTQTFLCRICLENVPVANRLILAQCGRPAHAACSDCLRTYLRLRVEEARVDELRCPCTGADGCNAEATEEELRSWLGEEVFEKFRRFSRMRADPKLRACPSCGRLCSPEVGEDGNVVAEMSCATCSCAFCYHHSNAHPPGAAACAEYERTVVRRQLLEMASGLQGTKRCPRCSFPTERASGCNHMTCRCKADWCWVCGRELGNIGWHYNPANPNGCTQFQEEPVNRHDGRMLVLCKILCMPVVAISLVFVVLFALVLLLLFMVPIAVRCKEIGFRIWIGAASFIVGLPFGAFCLVWGLLGTLLWTVLLPCGASEVHLHFILGVPCMTVLALGEGVMSAGRS